MIAADKNPIMNKIRVTMRLFTNKLCLALIMALSSMSVIASEKNEQAQHGVFSGSIGAVTKYVYRGGVENNDVAFQGGLEYTHNTGVFLSYWGSTLDYDSTDVNKDHGFEHDLGIGYTNEINEELSYRTQVTAFIYHNGGSIYNEDQLERRRSTGTEWFSTLNYKKLNLGLGISLSDANYGNAGDIYLTAGYSQPLIEELSLNTSIGASVYNDRRDDSIIQTEKIFTVNETRIGLSTPLSNSGVDIALDYIWGGKNRLNEKLDDHLVFAVNYSF